MDPTLQQQDLSFKSKARRFVTQCVRVLRVTTGIFILAGLVLVFFDFSPVTYVASIALGAVSWLFFGPGVNAYLLSKAPVKLAMLFLLYPQHFRLPYHDFHRYSY